MPHTSKHLYSVFKYAPSSVQAEYLLARHIDIEGNVKPGNGLITKILRYPICTQTVLEAVFRHPSFSSSSYINKGAIELPRRLVRPLSPHSAKPWTVRDEPLPFFRYLYNHTRIPKPDPNCHDGYALTRAVAAGFIPLVQFLLEQGASPACKGGIAVQAAIRRRNLPLVKMLIEPDARSINTQSDNLGSCPLDGTIQAHSASRRRRRQDETVSGKSGSKKRKLEDRVRVSQEMLRTAVACDARDIVKYFMEEKSCVPDMQTVRLMRH